MQNAEGLKRLAGERAAKFVRDGMIVGLGTGSTVYYTVMKLGQMVRAGEISIIGIPTSKATEKLAVTQGIKLGTLDEYPVIDLTIDGADEVDPNLDLIKGMGGALLREKVVASVSKEVIIIVDSSKLVDVLGTKSSLPVEVLPFALTAARNRLESLCTEAKLRERDGYTFVSDNGNYIIDCKFESIPEPGKLEIELNRIPGVVENGLFIGMATRVILGTGNGVKTIEKST
ncbi:MAG: ribose-5-phosphate isomerase RpiA [Candidatus Thermoplasmatota archaeon]|nr:ribose-5-phosphate isomerase RpiA [Euryarchaeota archaeon]MBU4032813.1 ribose-5-phosphate isomerase RpiA [Candidatus Thermoplasmatota archaeon]MBU4071538.1 ribose-5-phosphate isomerase RpiA [Candidatus Thermoplasmatota archaeon]MBU4144502.1 ribose-5-phosphate isomerase RpiA [Candidatus Thermoplasmatota archaeon]MBU4592704.1 ribose-5-phosphate isomerase RpiA [Candidatus Thermoplasmatota archaeon]